MIRVPSSAITLIAVASLAVPLASQAAVVSYRVVGTVISVDGSNGLLPSIWSGATAGSTFSVVYEFQDAFPDSNPNSGTGIYPNSILSMVVTVDGQAFALPVGTGGGADDMDHAVLNDVPLGGNFVDQLAYNRVGCVKFDVSDSTGCYRGTVFLRESSLAAPTLLSSDDRVPLPWMVDLFGTREFRFSASDRYSQLESGSAVRDGFVGTITDMSAVPLPAAAWLLLSGVAGLGLLGRRRRGV